MEEEGEREERCVPTVGLAREAIVLQLRDAKLEIVGGFWERETRQETAPVSELRLENRE